MELNNSNEIRPKRSLFKRRWLRLVFCAVILAVLVVVAYGIFNQSKEKQESTNTGNESIPQFIQAEFVNLSKIFLISKFRSGSGHDFSSNGETCRSMKHYFNVQWTEEGEKERNENNGIPKPPAPGRSIDIFSPVDGKIVEVAKEKMPIGSQIYIKPDNAPSFTVRLFHIYLSPDFKEGSLVKAGQKIGEIGLHQNTDIAITTGTKWNEEFISYFEVMPDALFEKYKERGVKDRSELIVTKEDRDKNPLKCNGEQFAEHYDSTEPENHFIYLSGYTGPSKNREGPNSQTTQVNSQQESKQIRSSSSNTPVDQPVATVSPQSSPEPSSQNSSAPSSPSTTETSSSPTTPATPATTTQTVEVADPPVIKNLGVEFGPYDPDADRGGAFTFMYVQDKPFYEFGSEGGESTFFYWIAEDADVFAVADGYVRAVTFQPESNDYSILVSTHPTIPTWTIDYDHLVNTRVSVGDQITAGTVLGDPQPMGLGLGRVEIQLFGGTNAQGKLLSRCLFDYFDSSLISTYKAKLWQMMEDFNNRNMLRDFYFMSDYETSGHVGCLVNNMVEE